MITMTRIQGSSMGFSNFQRPIIQSPRMGGIFDFQTPVMPQFPNFDLPLAAGSPSGGGGADGGGAPAPAPAPGDGVPAVAPQDLVPSYYPPQQTYVVTQQTPPPPPALPATPEAPAQAIPTWAIIGGSLVVGMGLAALLLRP